ncbi:MAG: CYTH and CHAD domain-containing protein [Actinomycetota bacterium]|nr:CYTH and CHAD domain-containing protein [Actinomycetota bacterium]
MAKSDGVVTVRETERKYEATDAVELADPAKLLGLDTGSGAQEQKLEAVYFDTADLRLVRAGITLRRRVGGSDPGWHLKLPVGGDSRDELRMPVGRSRQQPPAKLVALTRVYTRGAALRPVAQLKTRRRRWLLADPDGHALAELVEDHVSAHTMGTQTRAASWREVEVELAEHGQVELLDRIERRLLALGAQRSGAGSKLGRLLADEVPAGPAAPEPDAASSAGEVVLAYLWTQAEQLRRYDPLVRRDAPDAVHQMRVAARRMRSALQVFRRVIDRDRTRELTAELKWVAGELAEARDSEVMAERLATMVAELPDELVLGPVAAAVTRSFERRQVDARQVALAALDSDRYLALHEAIDALLADPPLRRNAARPARRELRKSVARAYRRFESGMRDVDAASAGDQRDVALHETRKAAKRLRYATEAAKPALGKSAKRLRRRLKTVQELLGAHQDTVVSRPVLRELAAQAHLDGGNGFTYGLMHATETARADRAERDLPKAVKRLRKCMRGGELR